jgi:TPR repeat protein
VPYKIPEGIGYEKQSGESRQINQAMVAYKHFMDFVDRALTGSATPDEWNEYKESPSDSDSYYFYASLTADSILKKENHSQRIHALYLRAYLDYKNSHRRDYPRMCANYNEAIELGHVDAMIDRAELHELFLEHKEAIALYDRAIEHNCTKAMINLARLYRGAQKNNEAFKLYERAIQLKDSNAMFILGLAYQLGQMKLVKSTEKAVEYFSMACELGHKLAATAMDDIAKKQASNPKNSVNAPEPERQINKKSDTLPLQKSGNASSKKPSEAAQLLELVKTICNQNWHEFVPKGSKEDKEPAGILALRQILNQSIPLGQKLEAICSTANRKQSGCCFQWFHHYIRGRHPRTELFYGILSKIKPNDASIHDVYTKLIKFNAQQAMSVNTTPLLKTTL